MGIIGKGNWNKTRSISVRLGKDYNQRESCASSSPKWLAFWRRLKMHKKKSFNNNSSCSSSGCVYDAETYMQNFDEGSEKVEPDNLCMSFSARYAHTSRIENIYSQI